MSSFAAASSNPHDAGKRLQIGFLNWAHAIDHFVLGIYPTVVIGLEVVYRRPYSELIALATAMFVAFGVFSLPAGWLANRWSRRNMMVAFYVGCGLALLAAAAAHSLPVMAAALFGLGVFAAIYHPVGMAMLIEISQARGRTLAFNGVCGNLGVALAAGILFSSPITTSRLRKPISASIHTTLWPLAARATAKFAVVVVLPTPPFPELTVNTVALNCLPTDSPKV